MKILLWLAFAGMAFGQTGNLPAPGVPGLGQSTLIATQLPHWRKTLANVRAGLGNAKILFAGDSTTEGFGDSTASSQPWLNSYPTQTGALINNFISFSAPGLGVPTSVFGTGSADTRWSIGSGWSNTSYGAGGGAAFQATGTTGNLTYTSTVNADTYYVYYMTGSGFGNLSLIATGGTVVNVSASGSSSITRTLVSAAVANTGNVVTITSSGGSNFIVGVEPVLSTAVRILIGNAGVAGSTTTEWTASATYGGAAMIKANAPDLTVISLGINDAVGSVSPATVIANLQTLITAAQVSGDVILSTWPPSSTSPTGANEAAYYPLFQSLASLQ